MIGWPKPVPIAVVRIPVVRTLSFVFMPLSPVQGVFRRPITPRVLKKVVVERKESLSLGKGGRGQTQNKRLPCAASDQLNRASPGQRWQVAGALPPGPTPACDANSPSQLDNDRPG